MGMLSSLLSLFRRPTVASMSPAIKQKYARQLSALRAFMEWQQGVAMLPTNKPFLLRTIEEKVLYFNFLLGAIHVISQDIDERAEAKEFIDQTSLQLALSFFNPPEEAWKHLQDFQRGLVSSLFPCYVEGSKAMQAFVDVVAGKERNSLLGIKGYALKDLLSSAV